MTELVNELKEACLNQQDVLSEIKEDRYTGKEDNKVVILMI